MPWIQLLRAARDNVGEEYVGGDGTVSDDRTAMVARMGGVTVGRRLSQEWARCDDGTAAVARMGEVTIRLLTTVKTAVSRTLREFEKMCLN